MSLLFSPFPEALRTGNIIPDSATVIARMRLAIAVKKGAPKPDISTPDAVRRTLLNAKSIVSVDPSRKRGRRGAAGARQARDHRGLKPRIKWVPTGGVVQDSVPKGETSCIGPYLSEMRNPGLEVVGAPVADGARRTSPGHLEKHERQRRGRCSTTIVAEVAPVYRSANMSHRDKCRSAPAARQLENGRASIPVQEFTLSTRKGC